MRSVFPSPETRSSESPGFFPDDFICAKKGSLRALLELLTEAGGVGFQSGPAGYPVVLPTYNEQPR
jgi:hypothetical protein